MHRLLQSLVSPSGKQVTRGVLYARAEAEGTRLKNPYDTIVEVGTSCQAPQPAAELQTRHGQLHTAGSDAIRC